MKNNHNGITHCYHEQTLNKQSVQVIFAQPLVQAGIGKLEAPEHVVDETREMERQPDSVHGVPHPEKFDLDAATERGGSKWLNGEVCHNEYDKAFEITVESKTHVFDSFECAIHVLAPKCAHYDCRIIGHGLEANDKIFCCNHCARQEGVDKLQARI